VKSLGHSSLRCGATRTTVELSVGHLRKAFCSRSRSHLPPSQPIRKTPRTCLEAPFGEVVRATGPMARANPFRFSTKYQDDETDLLYYGHRYYNPSLGRWISRDRLEEYAGFNIFEFSLNDPSSLIDILGLGTWLVTVTDVSAYFENSIYAQRVGDPTGFIVTYKPAPGECPNATLPDGSVVLYQTITPPASAIDSVPQVDGTPAPHKAPKTGCPLPPAMGPAGPTPNSYVDSPTWGNPKVTGGVFKITAVAVCRSECKQKLLSTYYFEWDNGKRKITSANPNDRSQFNDAMATWVGK
jgi:RHS repeat-associated protein